MFPNNLHYIQSSVLDLTQEQDFPAGTRLRYISVRPLYAESMTEITVDCYATAGAPASLTGEWFWNVPNYTVSTPYINANYIPIYPDVSCVQMIISTDGGANDYYDFNVGYSSANEIVGYGCGTSSTTPCYNEIRYQDFLQVSLWIIFLLSFSTIAVFFTRTLRSRS